ncbi:glycoside hydrolase family 16 protein [Natronolimnohabitans innermongolicus]|uniref:Glycoside hydrolase family protein n=1 Tax=Natronolimnohabitans innermongolicus JCM 12255 TaxID=1227499 RepID=L9XGJ7_9EURY|nr:glycoside hydrolase family 16 protein [Natronolimnohabitans innermongolicus]ELY60737.1 glycoside hydrolase family protein [Natronolimnohabitans innermongolicus JCM 12255]
MTRNTDTPFRRTVLRTGAAAVAAFGAGCFSAPDETDPADNETSDDETIPDVPPEDDDELELVFEDWFEENTVDAGVWETEFPWGERIHNFNAYASTNNSYVYDDRLVLEAREEERYIGDLEEADQSRDVGGPDEETEGDDDDDERDEEQSDVVPYTTGVATPYRSFSPGFIEGRIRVPPTVDGFWPAFWLTPDDAWPPEIDIFEFFGSDPCAYVNYHYRDSEGSITDDQASYCDSTFSDDFHEYAVDWREDRIVWYIDGEEVYRFDDEEYISTTEMRLILNFGVDASFIGEPSSDDLPAYMEIDWVRAWER